jgi:hypothetical protein
MKLPASARAGVVALLAAGMLTLAACAPEPSDGTTPPPDASVSTSSSPSAGATGDATADPTASPTPSPSATAVALPTDCRAILSEAVLAQLGETPLNSPDTGEQTGVQPDGSLVCLWRDARADTTYLRTEISRMSRGPALELLNGLAADPAYTCYTPDDGTRCEATWANPQYPVTDGRTLFWRSDVLIDTSFSNLAPSGYTDSIVAHLF